MLNTKQKAIFLDRDGVLNNEVGDYITKVSDFFILPHVAEGLSLLRDAGYIFIIVTNQGGIAKGLYTRNEMHQMHQILVEQMAHFNIVFHEIYYCPHHPDFGKCICRKPNPVLVEKAIAKHNINPSQSYFIGDKQRDIDAGAACGVNGILIEPNENWIPRIKNIISGNGQKA